MTDKTKNPYVLVTTKHRGVFVGELSEDHSPQRVVLDHVRMAIRFGTTKGLLELTETGPTRSTKMSMTAPSATLYDITGVFTVTPSAERGLRDA